MQTAIRRAFARHASFAAPAGGLSLADFVPDDPWVPAPRPTFAPGCELRGVQLIDGVEVTPLETHGDDRGSLVELLTTRDNVIEPVVHVYQVYAAPGSVRAWNYHEHQEDRLTYTQGDFLIVLYDIRPESPTRNMINELRLGAAAPAILRIPRFVVHGVKNCGPTESSFVNMPTNVYLPRAPDKRRLPQDDPRIPYRFE